MFKLLFKITLLCYFHIFFSKVVYSLAHNFYEKQKKSKSPKVFDIGHWKLRKNRNAFILYFKDALPLIAIFTMLILNRNIKTEVLVTTYIDFFISIIFVRYFTIIATILPKEETCNVKKFNLKQSLGYCYDQIFSGHFSAGLLASFMMYDLKILTNKPILYSYNILHAYIILLTRSHHTIDIIMAFFVTHFIYFNGYKFDFCGYQEKLGV